MCLCVCPALTLAAILQHLSVLGLSSSTQLHKQQLKAAFHQAAMQVGDCFTACLCQDCAELTCTTSLVAMLWQLTGVTVFQTLLLHVQLWATCG